MKTTLGLILLGACTGGYQEPPEVKSDLARDTTPDVSDQQLGALVGGNTEFAADLYRQVHTESGNLFLSPHSISTALAMTYAGAAGNTATQMADTLHFTLPPDQLHAAMDALDLDLASRAHDADSTVRPFQLHTANSIWGQTGKAFEAPFLDTLAVDYGAGLHVLDFSTAPDAARGEINDWVDQKTQHKILDLLPEGAVTSDTALVLTNAIYFSAAWQTPFDAANTQAGPFTTGGDAQVSVPMLHGSSMAGYGEGAGYKAGALPYDGGKLEMIVVVPDDLAAFESGLTAAKLAEITSSIAGSDLDLTMPKFTFSAPLQLDHALAALGMTDAFTSAADFSGIDGLHDLAISAVLHQGFVGVDEAGTEAAAATAVVIGPTSIPEHHTLVADRPFVFLIRDIPTGEILFLGRVVDPR